MTFGLDDPEACGRLWDLLATGFEKEQTLLSEDPVRVRISVLGDGQTLQLTLDEDLNIVGVRKSNG